MDDITKILRKAVREGWVLETGGRGHLKLRAPSGGLVIVSRSTSDSRAAQNILRDMRRAMRKS